MAKRPDADRKIDDAKAAELYRRAQAPRGMGGQATVERQGRAPARGFMNR
jgi:hypothetical protein